MSLLPVAEPDEVRRHATALLRRRRGQLLLVLGLQTLAAVAGLAGPLVLGRLVDTVVRHGTRGAVDSAAALFAAALLAQTALTFAARARGAVLGEAALAELREGFLTRVVRLPLETVERTDGGDLLARASSDVENLQDTVRRAVPEIVVALLQTTLLITALVITSPALALAGLLGALPLTLATRWYRRRAPAGYRRLLAREAAVGGRIAETAAAGRTVETFGLAGQRIAHTERDLRALIEAELYTLRLRTVWFPSAEFAYFLPLAGLVALGGVLHAHGVVSLGTITAAALYLRQLVDPVDALVSWMDELQIGGAALGRLIGVQQAPHAPDGTAEPADGELHARNVHYAYRSEAGVPLDVLHGVSLQVPVGGRIAVVGPSGAGKSTLGRLLAGVVPPRTGTVTVGGESAAQVAPERLRRHVALVTQEQHVFIGTLRDNLLLARPGADDGELLAALEAVDAQWGARLPAGLDTVLGSGGLALSPGEAQQLALARLVLVDPDTLILDEATSLLDPRAARHLERSLAAVLDGRTVVAIAHRLSTAFDADLVAVVDGGRITEIGTHPELVAAGAGYAALWRSWQDDG
ncbi:MAG TPA: ABC transporter ATP-binding protein [Mycobacteriales bacterium]|jgi:ABC-type multidrug transport system fused ATPase/permease subunit|nr:ABC transporter ATP-binding protein [Mycobacteriales bacterium]